MESILVVFPSCDIIQMSSTWPRTQFNTKSPNMLTSDITFFGTTLKKVLIRMSLCNTDDQIVDIFTKALRSELFLMNLLFLGLMFQD